MTAESSCRRACYNLFDHGWLLTSGGRRIVPRQATEIFCLRRIHDNDEADLWLLMISFWFT